MVYGSHLVRAFQRWAASLGLTGFVLFADIASAYYSTVRELIAGRPGASTEGVPEAALASLNLSHEDLDRLRAHALEPPALRQAGADAWTEAVSHCVTDGTFFLIRGDTVAVSTHRGTRPGSSWADILFAAVMQRVLRRRDELRNGLLYPTQAPKIPWDGQRVLTPCEPGASTHDIDDVVWADDLATMRLCQRNSRPGGHGLRDKLSRRCLLRTWVRIVVWLSQNGHPGLARWCGFPQA